MDSKCSVWRAEFLINRWMAIDGLSLADARRRVEAPSSPRPTTAVTETPQGRDHETRAQGAASGRGSMQADGPANAGPAVSQSGCWSGGPPPFRPLQVERGAMSPAPGTSSDRGLIGASHAVHLAASAESPPGNLGPAVHLAGPKLYSPRRRLETDERMAGGQGQGSSAQYHQPVGATRYRARHPPKLSVYLGGMSDVSSARPSGESGQLYSD